jgi:hypothetical protein
LFSKSDPAEIGTDGRKKWGIPYLTPTELRSM